MSSRGWNCNFSSTDHNFGGFTTSSDRITCTYNTNSGFSLGGFFSSDSSYGGPSKGGEGYGGGLSFGFNF